MKIYAISPESEIPGEIETIQSLLDAGLEAYHLRRPQDSVETASDFLDRLPDDVRSSVVLHQEYGLVDSYGLGGYHWKDRDDLALRSEELQVQRGSGRSLSRSAHGRERLKSFPAEWDYIFLSPVFPSISKVGYQSEVAESGWAEITAEFSSDSLMALGGIDAASAVRACELGFSGVVLHGCLWTADDPVKVFESVRRALA